MTLITFSFPALFSRHLLPTVSPFPNTFFPTAHTSTATPHPRHMVGPHSRASRWLNPLTPQQPRSRPKGHSAAPQQPCSHMPWCPRPSRAPRGSLIATPKRPCSAMPAHFSVVTLDRAPVATLNRVLVARAGASPVAMPTGPGQRLHAGVLHTGDKFGIHLCILGCEAVCNKPVWQITASTNS